MSWITFKIDKIFTTLLRACFVALFTSFSFSGIAAVFTSAASGNWTDGTTWVGGIAPGASDEAVIVSPHNVTLTAFTTIQKLTINGKGKITMNTKSMWVGILESAGVTATTMPTITNSGTNRNLTIENSSNCTFAGIISGSVVLIKEGTGTLTLSGKNTYTGGTTINAGRLRIGDAGIDGQVDTNIDNNSELEFNRSNVYAFDGVISGAGTVINTSGTLIISSIQTYTGPTLINGGRIQLNAPNLIPNSSPVNIALAGMLDLNGFAEGLGAVTGTGRIYNDAGMDTVNLQIGLGNASCAFDGQIINSSWAAPITLDKRGTGTLSLSKEQQFTGRTIVTAGKISLSGTNTAFGRLGNCSKLTMKANTNIDVIVGSDNALFGTAAVPVEIANGAELTTANGVSCELNGAVRMFGGIISSGTPGVNGSWKFNAPITTGGSNTSIISATSAIPGGNPQIFDVANGAAAIDLSITGTLSDNGATSTAITKQGLGTMQLGLANTYSGQTLIEAGTVKIGNASALGTSASGTVVSSGATLDLDGTVYSQAEPLTISGIGQSSLGALANTSTTAASFAGPITLASDSRISANTGDLALTYAGQLDGNGYALAFDGSKNGSISSAISANTLSVDKYGTGSWLFSGNNLYTGVTTVNAGTLVLGSATALGTDDAGTTIVSGATLDLGGQTCTNVEQLTIAGSGASGKGAIANLSAAPASFAGSINLTFGSTVNSVGNITLSGEISGARNLTKIGSGDLNFASNNVALSTLTISQGVLNAASSNISIAKNFTNTGTFASGTSTVSFTGSTIQTVDSAGFYNLDIANSAGDVYLNAGISAAGTVSCLDGLLVTGAFTVELGTTGSLVEATPNALNPDSYILGKVRCLRPIGNTSGTQDFGGIGIEINEGNTMNNLTEAIRSTGTACIGSNGNSSITRYFVINPATDFGLDADLMFHYFENEATGFTESNLSLYKSPDSQVTWQEQLSIINTAGNELYLGGISDFSTWTAADHVTSSLPIELAKQSAKNILAGTIVEWSTLSETNNEAFLLERSLDGQNWDVVFTCPGAGTSSTLQSYSFTDTDVAEGLVYYRIAQKDFNGESSTGQVFSNASEQAGQKVQLSISGNSLLIATDGSVGRDLDVTIASINGQLIAQDRVSTQNGQARIALGNKSSDIITVSVSDGNSIESKTLIIK